MIINLINEYLIHKKRELFHKLYCQTQTANFSFIDKLNIKFLIIRNKSNSRKRKKTLKTLKHYLKHLLNFLSEIKIK